MKDLSGQLSGNASMVYENFFVPALFEQWTSRVAQLAHIQPNDSVLDVACGTGILARHIKKKVSPTGKVIGIDPNENMIAVAAQVAPGITWDLGVAESLPYKENSFDAVVSQFGLMFFNDRGKALGEMMGVLKPGKYMAVAVWDKLENSPGYVALTGLLKKQFGNEVAEKLRAPFALGNKDDLMKLFHDAGIGNVEITTLKGTAQFPSIRSWIFTDVRGWVFSDLVNDKQLDELATLAENELTQFTDVEGKVKFDISAHVAIVHKQP